jgi:uncharacterized protein YjiS (DUF1127 family)
MKSLTSQAPYAYDAKTLQSDSKSSNSTHALKKYRRQLIKQLRIWHQRYRTRKQLAQLNTVALKDIGVSRSEAIKEAKKWFWQN